MRTREFVTAGVNDAMNAVEADVVAEDGMLFRACKCGVRHPVGHLHRQLWPGPNGTDGDQIRHYANGDPSPFIRRAACCGCCIEWDAHLSDKVA